MKTITFKELIELIEKNEQPKVILVNNECYDWCDDDYLKAGGDNLIDDYYFIEMINLQIHIPTEPLLTEEEMKALVEMNNMLKAKLEQQTKVYQQSLQEMQMEIDDLQRNCDVFNEQMNDAVERAMELQKQLQAYKDKEDKIREYLKKEKEDMFIDDEYYAELEPTTVIQKVLQILNEGDK